MRQSAITHVLYTLICGGYSLGSKISSTAAAFFFFFRFDFGRSPKIALAKSGSPIRGVPSSKTDEWPLPTDDATGEYVPTDSVRAGGDGCGTTEEDGRTTGGLTGTSCTMGAGVVMTGGGDTVTGLDGIISGDNTSTGDAASSGIASSTLLTTSFGASTGDRARGECERWLVALGPILTGGEAVGEAGGDAFTLVAGDACGLDFRDTAFALTVCAGAGFGTG